MTKEYINRYKEMKAWLWKALEGHWITVEDASERLVIVELAFTKQEPIPDVRNLMPSQSLED